MHTPDLRAQTASMPARSQRPPVSWDFANILFAGPCNRFCPFCIGKEVPGRVNVNNLDLFPPANWDAFVAECARLCIREIVFTGTTSDPHLYKHEARLIAQVRQDLPQARISIHTNGVLSLRKIEAFNLYDRACISFPSFNPATYARMMGVTQVPDLGALLAESKIPVKISCVVNEHNVHEVDGFLMRLADLGIQRVVLRRLYGDRRPWNILPDLTPARYYRDNPVYEYKGACGATRLRVSASERSRTMEVTWWNFDTTTSKSINLFADGTIGESYLLAETQQFKAS
jgi:MoaA/NifB/PqqE/SkfB family radical SAM enzyme